jgi:hypothetical protein
MSNTAMDIDDGTDDGTDTNDPDADAAWKRQT